MRDRGQKSEPRLSEVEGWVHCAANTSPKGCPVRPGWQGRSVYVVRVDGKRNDSSATRLGCPSASLQQDSVTGPQELGKGPAPRGPGRENERPTRAGHPDPT